MNPTTAHHAAAIAGPGFLLLLALLACSAPPPQPGGAGAPALAALAGKTWRLAELGPGEPVPPDAPPVTLTFAGGGRISGSTGCNRYFADVTSAAPGTLRTGPIAATKRACREPAMSTERRFLGALGKVFEYALEGENLVLRFRREDAAEPGRLLFVPGPPDSEAGEDLPGA